MKQIKNTHYEGERPLFASHGLYLEEVTIHAGESALKECSDIEAVNCRFEGKYPFWHNDGFVVKGYISGSTEDVSRNGRSRTRKCTVAQCFGNTLVLPECGTEQCEDR